MNTSKGRSEDMMYGVVLWSAPDSGTAVIWCEDQGDLAYLDGSGCTLPAAQRSVLDAGDYVSFDLEIRNKMRCAHNARRIGCTRYEGLASQLEHGAASAGAKTERAGRSAQVIDFSDYAKHRVRASLNL